LPARRAAAIFGADADAIRRSAGNCFHHTGRRRNLEPRALLNGFDRRTSNAIV